MSKKSLKAGFVQHANKGDREQNLHYISTQIADLAKQGTQLVVLQELHNGAYFCQQEDIAYFDLAENISGPTFEFLSQTAKTHHVVIVASIFEKRAEGIYHNTALVIDNDGTLAGYYRKMHIPDDPGFYEKFYFTPGDHDVPGFQPILTRVGKLGVLVCWDQWYPEAARLMALAGAEILIYPTAIGWNPNDEIAEQQRQQMAWQIVQQGHAVANHLPVISCNRIGFEPDPAVLSNDSNPNTSQGILFWGKSFIAGPQGNILLQADANTASSQCCEIILQQSADLRKIWPFFRDRRIDAYNKLVKRYIDSQDTPC